ncbi:Hypothetical predicted protein [Pelobates cultripes]|uniref:Uncharacterized protein n=1 Tax=Pelobates cultripes TaxID=61616 RepID=A0AAD1RZU2_PELCU|nr:Hypothetical predicted protein [Pelobates cultripes]
MGGCPDTPCEQSHSWRAPDAWIAKDPVTPSIKFQWGIKRNLQPLKNIWSRAPAKNLDLDRYFREKVKALTHDEDSNMAAAPRDSDSPPHSPAFLDQSTITRDTEIKEMLQNIPSKSDLASMLACLEESMQEQISSITRDLHHVGEWGSWRTKIFLLQLQLKLWKQDKMALNKNFSQ